MIKTIKSEVNNLIKKYNTNNPTDLCELLGYNLIFCDLPACQNGLYLEVYGKKTIIINNKVSNELRDFYIAHELGHSLLHERVNHYFLSQSTNLVSGRYEREADLFAVYLLMKNENFIEETLTKQDLSLKLGVPFYVIDNIVSVSA